VSVTLPGEGAAQIETTSQQIPGTINRVVTSVIRDPLCQR